MITMITTGIQQMVQRVVLPKRGEFLPETFRVISGRYVYDQDNQLRAKIKYALNNEVKYVMAMSMLSHDIENAFRLRN